MNFPLLYEKKSLRNGRYWYPDDRRHVATIQAEVERAVGLRIQEWMHVSDGEVRDLAERITGDFVMLRKSVRNPNEVVKSRLKITRFAGGSPLLVISHLHKDRQNVDRVSKGIITRVVRNIYAVPENREGEGIEMLALRDPVQELFEKLNGFLISMNMDRKILSARVCIERNSKRWEALTLSNGYREHNRFRGFGSGKPPRPGDSAHAAGKCIWENILAPWFAAVLKEDVMLPKCR